MPQAHSNGPVLDDQILADEEVDKAIKQETSVHRSYEILNTDRATLGRVGGAIARLHGDTGFAGTVSIEFQVCPICTHLWYCSQSLAALVDSHGSDFLARFKSNFGAFDKVIINLDQCLQSALASHVSDCSFLRCMLPGEV